MEKTAGVYHLQEVKTTASGFKLNPDGSFLFFFTYGAIDRYGSGNWIIDNDHVVLQSRPWSGKDFAWVGSKEINQNFISMAPITFYSRNSRQPTSKLWKLLPIL